MPTAIFNRAYDAVYVFVLRTHEISGLSMAVVCVIGILSAAFAYRLLKSAASILVGIIVAALAMVCLQSAGII